MMPDDRRNVIDSLKGKTEAAIVAELDMNGVRLEIAVENIERDFNMGSIVRSANAFGVRHVHVIGKRQWNKRGAMATDKYMHVHHYPTTEQFVAAMRRRGLHIAAVDNMDGAVELSSARLPQPTVLVFGSEASGLSAGLSGQSDELIEIRQKGSTRSLNVGAAAAIAMYEWSRRHSH